MFYFIILICSASVSISVMVLLLLYISNLDIRATEWIYRLVKLGLVFFTIPVIVFVMIVAWDLFKPIRIPSLQADFSVYYKKFFNVGKVQFAKYNYLMGMFYLWLLGVIFNVLKFVVSVFRFHQNVLVFNMPIQNSELADTVDEIKNDLKIKQKVSVYFNKLVETPSLVLLKKPMVILGDTCLSKQELFYVIKHELTHLKRKHILFKRLCIVLKILYWFNPFIYLFERFFCDYCELDCDREVLSNKGMTDRILYAGIILKLIPKKVSKNPAIESTFCNRGKKSVLERRFKNIMNERAVKISKKIIMGSLCYALCCPMIVYASTFGGIKLQNDFAEKTLSNKINKEMPAPYHYDTDKENQMIKSVQLLNPRGKNSIDDSLEADQSIEIAVTAQAATIRVNLSADSSDVQFGVQVGDEYVTSVDGLFSYTFNVTAGEQYTLRIDNLSDNTINISGEIYI